LNDVGAPQGAGIGQVDRDGQLVGREGPDGTDVVGGSPEQLEVIIATFDIVAEEAPVRFVESNFLPQQDEVVDAILADLVKVVALPVDGTEVVAEAEVKVDVAQVLLGFGQNLLDFPVEHGGFGGDFDHAEADAEVEAADLGANGEGDLESRVDPGVDLDVVSDVGASSSEDRCVRVELEATVLGGGGQGQGQAEQNDQGKGGFDAIHGFSP
jgi:hypothetical protein